MGSGVPSVHNLRSMPTPGAPIWPQMLMDFEFEGHPIPLLATQAGLGYLPHTLFVYAPVVTLDSAHREFK